MVKIPEIFTHIDFEPAAKVIHKFKCVVAIDAKGFK